MKHRQFFYIFSRLFLQISNAQTKEEYKDDQCLIPKNTSLIVARIPISNQNKKSWDIAQSSAERAPPATENINHDISRMNGSEEDKIQAMMMQSTLEYDPTKYVLPDSKIKKKKLKFYFLL
jgi:E3 ubiquitin-protein ligase RBBP6